MIVCAKCNRALRPKRNGVYLTEMAEDRPYKLWAGDLWECQECGQQVVYVGDDRGQKPISESWRDDFSAKLESFKPQYQAKEWNR